MTIEELQALLATMPADAKVFVRYETFCEREVVDIKAEQLPGKKPIVIISFYE
jgi:hypothetical protein